MDEELVLPLISTREEGQQGDASARKTGSSLGATTFNTVNLFLGIGLLSMPYAIKKGGWLALVLLCLTTLLFCLSAHLIILAFDRLPPSAQRTYPELGAHAGGRAGRRLVVCFALVELFGSGCIVLLVVWEQLVLVLPDDGLWGIPALQLSALAASCLMAPMLLIRNYSKLSGLSLLGFSSSVLVTAVVLSLLPLDPHRTRMPEQPPPGHTLASVGMLQSAGIFAVSVSGHSTLPSLRAAMRQPSHFPRVLNATFGTMLATYAALAAAGYYYFGDSAAPVVTSNLAQDSVFTGHALAGVITVDRALAGLILVNCLTKYPIIVMVMQDMLLSLFPSISTPRGTMRAPRHGVMYAVRYAVFGAGVALCWGARSMIGCVVSLVGGLCSISCSLLLPSAFYALLAWKDLRWAARVGLVALLLGGATLVCSITTHNVVDIIARARERQGEGPSGGGLMMMSGGVLEWGSAVLAP